MNSTPFVRRMLRFISKQHKVHANPLENPRASPPSRMKLWGFCMLSFQRDSVSLAERRQRSRGFVAHNFAKSYVLYLWRPQAGAKGLFGNWNKPSAPPTEQAVQRNGEAESRNGAALPREPRVYKARRSNNIHRKSELFRHAEFQRFLCCAAFEHKPSTSGQEDCTRGHT